MAIRSIPKLPRKKPEPSFGRILFPRPLVVSDRGWSELVRAE